MRSNEAGGLTVGTTALRGILTAGGAATSTFVDESPSASAPEPLSK